MALLAIILLFGLVFIPTTTGTAHSTAVHHILVIRTEGSSTFKYLFHRLISCCLIWGVEAWGHFSCLSYSYFTLFFETYFLIGPGAYELGTLPG